MNKKFNQGGWQFLLYCACGGIGVLSDLSTYYGLLFLSVNYQICNLMGYGVGTLISFFLNRRITFGVKNKLKSRFAMFIAVALLGYVSSAIFLEILVSIISVDPKISKIITLPLILLLQYSLNKKITFKQ